MKNRLIAGLTGLVALSAVAGGWSLAGRAADAGDQGFIAGLISRALTTPASRVQIGGVDGVLSSDVTVRDIVISDRRGPWLRLDRARLQWSRAALLLRRLEINSLEIGKLEILRKPLPSEQPVPEANQPLLPELPVKVNVQAFNLNSLALGQDVIGVASSFSASGNASLGNPSEGLSLVLDAKRTDQPGTFAARLSFVPTTKILTLASNLNEPAGGLISTLANLPDRPPVTLDLTGNGTLDNFAAKLAFDAGASVGANGNATLQRQGGVRQLVLDLGARIAGLTPAPVAPIFPGTTQLQGTVVFGDDGGLSFNNLFVASSVARLDVNGQYRADKTLDIHIGAGAVPTQSGVTAAGDAEIRKLYLDAKVTGALTVPHINASLNLEQARTPQGRIEKLDATFTADPTGDVTDAATRIALDAKAQATGLAPADRALARALGDSVNFTLHGSAGTDGNATFDIIRADAASADIRYTGDIGRDRVHGTLTVAAPDLTRFGALAGLALKGEANANVALDGALKGGAVAATVDARVTRFGTGVAAVDNLAGETVTANGLVRTLLGGGYGLENVTLKGAQASLFLNGSANPDVAAITAHADIADLRRADPRLSGRAAVDAHLTGTLDKPNADATIQITDATALGRPVPRLAITTQARDLLGALDAQASLDGSINGRPAQGQLHVRRPDPDSKALSLDAVDITIGRATIKGQASLDAAALASGRITADVPDLDDLSVFALTKLAGSLRADIALDTPNGGQNAHVTAAASGVKFGTEASVAKLDLDATVIDAYRRPVVNANGSLSDAAVAGQTIDEAHIVSTGNAAASDITADARALGFLFNTQARLVPQQAGQPLQVQVSALTASRGAQRIALAGPTVVALADGGATIRNLAIAVNGGRVTVDGRVGTALDVKATVQALPLSAAEIVKPGLGLGGVFDGTVDLHGTTQAPTGTFQATLAGLTLTQARSAGVPPLDVKASGTLNGTTASVDAAIAAGRAGTLNLKGTVPLSQTGPIDVKVAARAFSLTTAALAKPELGLAGTVDLDADVHGTIAAPTGTYTVRGSGLTVKQARDAGVPPLDLRATGALAGTSATVNATVAAGRAGTLAINGTVPLSADGPIDVKATARGFSLNAVAAAKPGLGLGGTLDLDAELHGRLAALTGSYRVAVNRLVLAQTRSAGLAAIDARAEGRLEGQRATVNANVSLGRGGSVTITGSAPLAATGALDLAVRGRLDAALANGTLGQNGERVTGALAIDMTVGGTIAKPALNGSANLTGGSFNDALQGIDLTAIRASIVARGEDITIASASAATKNGGSLSASGRVRVDPAAGFPGDIRITGTRANLVSNGIVDATVNLGLALSGPLARTPRVTGHVDILEADVRVPERLPSTLKPLDNTRHVHATGTAAARLAQKGRVQQVAARKGQRNARSAAFAAALDLTVSAPGRIFVRGRGIDAELGGDLRLTGSSAAPTVNGGFDLRRGRFQAFGTRLDFSKGRVVFNGDVIPDLDFSAQTQAGDVTAIVNVTGPASSPTFDFTSEPALPQDEVLSRLLFGKASGGLSPFQALQLAQAAGVFGNGDSAFEGLRKSLGVDDVDLQIGANGPTLGIQRAIGDRARIEIKAGALPADTGVDLTVDVTKHFKAEAGATADGGASAGVRTEFEW